MALSTNPDDITRELQSIRNEFDGVKNIVNGWTAGGSFDPAFRSFRADFGEFLRPPMDLITLLSTSNQSLSDADYTPVVFQRILASHGGVFSWSSNSPTVLQIRNPSPGNLYMFAGNANYTANSSGFRQVVWGATSDITVNMATIGAVTGGATVVPFCDGSVYLGDATTALLISAWQNSGGALNLTRFSLMAMRIGLV